MNVLIIGAAGKTGAIVVERALAAGHVVTAFVRDAATYRAPANVRVVAGDATDQASVDNAMARQDAVINTVAGKTPYRKTALERRVDSGGRHSDEGERSEAPHQHQFVRRRRTSADQAGWFVNHVVVPTWLRGSTEDKAAAEEVVRASGIPFVIVRPAMLTHQAATGNVKVFQGRQHRPQGHPGRRGAILRRSANERRTHRPRGDNRQFVKERRPKGLRR